MKTLKLALLLSLLLSPSAWAAEAGFFRVAGPVESTITALDLDGYLTWTNAATNATFTVQKAAALPGATNWNDYVQVPVTNPATRQRMFDPSPPAGMALIPAGSFDMGDALGDGYWEYPIHPVSVSAFYMDKCEVSKQLWGEVYTWAITNGYNFHDAGAGKTNNHPVHSVSWFDAVKWCNARSKKEGRTPAYYSDAAMTLVYTTGQVEPFVRWDRGYRLPTEAEWEKAARGGLSGKRFPWGDTITHSQANYYSDSRYAYDTSSTRGYHPNYQAGGYPYTSRVASFAANGYGLYDMVGNMWEWCWDWYERSYYSSSSDTDPRGPSAGSGRVARGGCWGDTPWYCRSANRINFSPTNSDDITGFRSVLPSGQ